MQEDDEGNIQLLKVLNANVGIRLPPTFLICNASPQISLPFKCAFYRFK